jgi:UDP-N-acetylglucosamine 2-epimerase (non-hydrolysing)
MYKIITLVGTRPELIKLSQTIIKLDKNFKNFLVHSGQNYDYELNKIFFKDLKIRKPDFFLNVKNKLLSKTISNIIFETDKIIDKIKPDAILVYGDTNTSLGLISAKRKKVPIFHMEAGNRCYDFRVPEEINRRIVDHISDVNLTISEQAKQNLIAEGLDRNMIFKIGSNMKEVIDQNIEKIYSSQILKNLKLKKKEYIVVSLHREENVDNKNRLVKVINMLNNIKTKLKKEIIFSTHPRTKKMIKLHNIPTKKIKFLKPFGFFDYCNLQNNSYCTISDSGTIFEEAAILDFPAITLRSSHERHEGAESGVVIITDFYDDKIIDTIKLSINSRKSFKPYVGDYMIENVSQKVVNIIQSYIKIINNKVWKKNEF